MTATPATEPVEPAFVELAHRLADAARAVALPHFRADLAIEIKDDASPVTRADRETEAAMRAILAEAAPDHGILGEEEGGDRLGASHVWVLDPIDGTRAFINGIPLFATLIALVRDGVPVLGLNEYPALGERWLGLAGDETRHWGRDATQPRPVHGRPCPALAKAQMCTTSPEMFSAADARRYAALRARVADARFGTDAWAYAMTASGHTDLVAESGMKPYDYLSHAVIVAGAGGTITDWEGRPLGLDSPGSVLAAGDPAIHAEALAALAA